MPVVKPRSGEEKQAFISRCMEQMVGEGRPQKIAAGICYSQWRKKNKQESMETVLQIAAKMLDERKALTKAQKRAIFAQLGKLKGARSLRSPGVRTLGKKGEEAHAAAQMTRALRRILRKGG